MRQLTPEALADAIVRAPLKPRMKRELRYQYDDLVWVDREFVVLMSKTGKAGLLVVSDPTVRALPFQLQRRRPRAGSGTVEPIICDICATWRRGTESALISFGRSDGSSLTWLCCSDLRCSLNARGLTKASVVSKTQLRETVGVEAKIERLGRRLDQIIDYVG